MTESPALERRYRRLLAWYPQRFRREQEDEMLAVLMAGAAKGQRRPGLRESADVLRSALGMRLSRALQARAGEPALDRCAGLVQRGGAGFRGDGRSPRGSPAVPPALGGRSPFLFHRPGPVTQIGGLSLLNAPFFDIALGLQVIVAAFALLGRRRLTLIAMASSVVYWIVYWVVFRYGISAVPDAPQLLTASAYILGATAMLASPGPPRGRHLVNWRHWAVLLPAAGLVQVLTLASYARSRFAETATLIRV